MGKGQRRKISSEQRKLNLLTALMNSDPLTYEEIYLNVPGYVDAEGKEMDLRTFERDKAALRDVGIALVVKKDSNKEKPDVYSVEIDAEDAQPPALDLTPQQIQILDFAASLWQNSAFEKQIDTAVTKVKASTLPFEENSDLTAKPLRNIKLQTVHVPELKAIAKGISGKHEIRFHYASQTSQTLTQRKVLPAKLLQFRNLWYLYGIDRNDGQSKFFKLSRFRSKVSVTSAKVDYEIDPNLDLREMLNRQEPGSGGIARIKVQSGYEKVFQREYHPRADQGEEWAGKTWLSGEVAYLDEDQFISRCIQYLDRVVIVGPKQLRKRLENDLHSMTRILSDVK